MVARLSGEAEPVILRFGGGNHSRASEDEIDPRECKDGQNYKLDLENNEFRPRNGYEQIGITPNAAEIRGFASLRKSDGSLSVLVQSGTNLYEWNGVSFLGPKGIVATDAQIRGWLWHNWELDDKVIITDVNLKQPVSQWDGTTFQIMPTNLTGDFKAKYCFVSEERAWFFNVVSGSPQTATPHLFVASKRSDNTNLSVSNRPISGLGLDDPFFLLAPDLRGINGVVEAFQRIVFSSSDGNLWRLTGTDATNFAVSQLYPRSAATGTESMAYVGNDIVYGRQGRLESVLATEKFADVQTDDLTVPISDAVSSVEEWRTVYNQRTQKVYFFPQGVGEVWVLHKDLAGSAVSPWVKWTTLHSLDFQPTAVMNVLDPADGKEQIFMGDGSGKVYRLESSQTSDPGSADIRVTRESALFGGALDAQVYHLQGWIKYRADNEITLNLGILYSGEEVFTIDKAIVLPGVTGRPVYGGTVHYGGSYHYGTPFEGRLRRKKFEVPGQSNEYQIRLEVQGSNNFEVNEVGLRFKASS